MLFVVLRGRALVPVPCTEAFLQVYRCVFSSGWVYIELQFYIEASVLPVPLSNSGG